MKIYKIITVIGLFIFNMAVAHAGSKYMGTFTIKNESQGMGIDIKTDSECVHNNPISWYMKDAEKTIRLEADTGSGGKCSFQGSYIWYHLLAGEKGPEIAEVSFWKYLNVSASGGKVTLKQSVPGWTVTSKLDNCGHSGWCEITVTVKRQK